MTSTRKSSTLARAFLRASCHIATPILVEGMGGPSPMRRLCGGLLGIVQVALGLLMIVAPRAFYDAVPGVPETGPYNPHFVRDIGCAFLVAGVGLAWGATDPRGRAAAAAGAAFLWLHALIHVWDGLAGRERPEHLAHDLPMMLGFAAIATWTAWPRRLTIPLDRKGA
jgi:hypothetical protein